MIFYFKKTDNFEFRMKLVTFLYNFNLKKLALIPTDIQDKMLAEMAAMAAISIPPAILEKTGGR